MHLLSFIFLIVANLLIFLFIIVKSYLYFTQKQWAWAIFSLLLAIIFLAWLIYALPRLWRKQKEQQNKEKK